MTLHVDTSFESLNKYNEELCRDKVEVVKSSESVIVVLSDGLGSGVKANILATLTGKIIGTMLRNGASIDEAVETIASTLPVCKERSIAYSTFTILQIFNSGEGYLVEFDNPPVIYLRKGRLTDIESEKREISGKLVKESRFKVVEEDMFVMVSDGVMHAGINGVLNLGWQMENKREYIQRTYKPGISAKNITKLLLSVCENLYMQKPGDDATVVTVKMRKPAKVNVMVGPPVDKMHDGYVVNRFIGEEGKKVVCGGTTSKIVARELNRKVLASIKYFKPSVPPTAEIEGIDFTTEGVLTLGKTLDFARKYASTEATIQDFINLNKQDGVSRLSKILLEESTAIHFFVGRAMNPAHQNPDFPLGLSIKLKLVEELAEHLKGIGKEVMLEYF